MPKIELDYRLNIATVGSVILSFILFLMIAARHMEKQDIRINESELDVKALELKNDRLTTELQRLTIEIEKMRVELRLLARVVDKQYRERD